MRGYRDFHDAKHPLEGQLNAEDARLLRHGYFASVTYIDTQIGKVLDHLEQLNILHNTIIVLWGDNGWKLGDYGSWCKMTNYEMDTRVPLIIKPAGLRSDGGRRDQIVESLDIYPTLCDLAGIPYPGGLAGRSMAPLIADAHARGQDHAFSQFLRYGIWKAQDDKECMGYSIRTCDWRYVEWFQSDSDVVFAKELYDITNQGLEQQNLSGEPRYASIERNLAEQLANYRGATLPLPAAERR